VTALRSGRFSPDRRIVPTLAGVLAVHVALMALLTGTRTAPRRDAAPPRVTLRLISTALPPRPASPTDAAAARPVARTAASARARQPTPMSDRDSRATAAPTATTATTAIAAEPGASAPEPLPSLMESDATRRAIRASARTPSLSDQLAQSRQEPHQPSATDRLAIGVREAGKGDCAKGEYAGAGMGLLSLPFLAAAAVSGNCAK